MNEDEMLNRITLDAILAHLDLDDRVLLLLVYKLERPEDYDGPWPPNLTDVGRYVGLRFEGEVLSEAAVRYRRTEIIAFLRGERGPMRRSPPEIPENL